MHILKHYEALVDHLNAGDDELAHQFGVLLKVTLSNLEEDAMWAEALNQAGVDNWPGCDDARDIYDEMTKE